MTEKNGSLIYLYGDGISQSYIEPAAAGSDIIRTRIISGYEIAALRFYCSAVVALSVAAVDQLEEVTDGQLTGIDSGGHGQRLEIAVTSPYGHDHGQAV